MIRRDIPQATPASTAKHHANGADAGRELADFGVVPQTGQSTYTICQFLTTKEYQQNQDQIRYPAYDGGINRPDFLRENIFRQLGPGTKQSEYDREDQRQQRELYRHPCAR
jgi:hypothetical protein